MRVLICILFILPLSLSGQQTEPVLFVEKSFDFGNIRETGGNAVHEFLFTNNSGRVLRILSVQASCGCTTPGWTKDPVPPGMTGSVKASFDPKGRPGFFNKSLTVTTDVDSSPIVLQIKGQVTGEDIPVPATTGDAQFPAENGSLRFKFSSFPLGKLSINRPPVTREFPVLNAGDAVVNFSGKVSGPPYIKIETPKSLKGGEKGIIKITYDAKARNQYGFISDNIEIETDDRTQPAKSFSVFATIEEYFPTLTAAELSKAPALLMEVSTIDFGRAQEGTVIVREVTVKNSGKSDLAIRAIQGNCPCVTGTIGTRQIKPGGETKMKITFTTQGRTGIQQKAVTIYSNDPKNPVQRVTMSGVVEGGNEK